jgi:hypothetical protein
MIERKKNEKPADPYPLKDPLKTQSDERPKEDPIR